MKTSALVAALLVANTQALTPENVGQLVAGLLTGALHYENMDDFIDCTVKDGAKIAGDVEDALMNFESLSLSGVTAGLEDVADVFTTISAGIKECSTSPDIQKLDDLIEMLKSFKSPTDFAFHIGKDIIVNGANIFANVEDGLAAYKAENYEKVGEDLGVALDLVVFGQASKGMKINPEQALLIAGGILKGAVEAEGLSNLEACLTGGEVIIKDVVEAVEDFELGTAAGAANGLKVLAKLVSEIKGEAVACAGVSADWKKLQAMISVFDSPLTFAYHVGKDILVNGVQIYGDINDSLVQYRAEQFELFGEDIGKALALTLLGMEEIAHEQNTNNLFLF